MYFWITNQKFSFSHGRFETRNVYIKTCRGNMDPANVHAADNITEHFSIQKQVQVKDGICRALPPDSQ